MVHSPSWDNYAALRAEATLLAGGLSNLAQRAAVYHHLFQHSRGNHVFPLLAAHGALWARGYFQRGLWLGTVLSLQHAGARGLRRQRMAALGAFADAFRDINRRVCVETYAIYYASDRPDLLRAGASGIAPELLELMARCHAARRVGRSLSPSERRSLFAAFFLWEQDNVVGPAVDAAVAAFDWPCLRRLALTPTVRFSYLPRRAGLSFRNFADKAERIERGFQAFDRGAALGWDRVEGALGAYGVMPSRFLAAPAEWFLRMRESVLASALAPASVP